MTTLALVLLAVLSIGIVLVFIRLLRGPNIPDRLVALDLLTTVGVGIAALYCIAFDEPVYVSGTPSLDLDFDGTIKTAAYRALVVLRDKEGKPIAHPHMFFNYGVKVGDSDDDGIAIRSDALDLNGGTIRDRSGNDAKLEHPAVAADAEHKVDAPGGL